MDPYERQALINRLQAENAEMRADNEMRREKRLAGEVVPTWRAPEPQRIQPQTTVSEAAKRQRMHDRLERRLTQFAELIGEETGAAEKRLREDFSRQLGELRAAHNVELELLRGEIRILKSAPVEQRDPWPSRPKTAKRGNHVAH